MGYSYYESTLSPAERAAYGALLRGISASQRSFSAPRLDTARLGEIFNMMKLDHPLIFNAQSLAFAYSDRSTNVTVKPEYSMKKQEYESTLGIIEKRLGKVLAPAKDLSLPEKERFIHDYIVKSVRYDKLKKQYSHEVTGPLCHGIGVCEGMAKVFKLMCDEVGIESIVCTGIGVPPEAATGKKSERHAWNIVIMDGKALGVDATFDNSLSDDFIRYDYYNIPDSIMSFDHGNLTYPVPACVTAGVDYYSKEGLSFEDENAVLPALRRAAKPPHTVAFRLSVDPDAEKLTDSIKSLMSGEKRFRRFSKFAYKINHASRVVVLKLELRDFKEVT